MLQISKSIMVALLSVSLAGIPVMASAASSPAAPLGVILQADRAQVGADLTAGGATVYEGDRLGTNADGTLRARLGGAQMYLRANTSTQVHGLPNGFSADLNVGSVVLSSADGQTFRVLANGAIIRPAGSKATVAEVTRVNSKELLLTSTRGPLEISMGDEVKTIDAGTSYRMEVETAEAEPAPQSGPYHTARNHFILIAIVAVSVATAIGIWRALVSPSAM